MHGFFAPWGAAATVPLIYRGLRYLEGPMATRQPGKIEDPAMTTIKNVICFILGILWMIKAYDLHRQ